MTTTKLLLAALMLVAPVFGRVLPGEANNGLILDERAVAYAESVDVQRRSSLAILLSRSTADGADAAGAPDGGGDAGDAHKKKRKGKKGKKGKEEKKGKEGKKGKKGVARGLYDP